MGVIGEVMGLGRAAGNLAEVFVANRTARDAQEHLEQVASLQELGAEFARPAQGWFDRLIDGLNRLPRPALALGTLGLFIYAMADPVSFGVRMQGLALVPDPLWWLLGAIVSFYFGAREMHHLRSGRVGVSRSDVARTTATMAALRADAAPAPMSDGQDGGPVTSPPPANAALAQWRAAQG